MRAARYGRYGLGICASVALLSGCGGPQLPIGAPGVVQQSVGGSAIPYKQLYRFRHCCGDGARPVASLINVGGTLYGTTSAGGTYHEGTVFDVTTTGKETVLHSFGFANDGVQPSGALINVNGTLYGTTAGGGKNGYGIVFSVTTAGSEAVLHNFNGGFDGAYPNGSLISVKGTLYGTTYDGGAKCANSSGCGTVFRVTTAGKEKVIYSFGGGSDGANPFAGLIHVKSTLYGTTGLGGAACAGSLGCGTVFSVTTTGKERVLYSFGSLPDAENPFAGLINVKGTLYGTTGYGGAKCTISYGCGAVFSVTTTGKERVLYSFGGDSDGAAPVASLIDVKGTLYGTTEVGGAADDGTVFSVTTTGGENVLYSFGGGSDGAYPYAGLISVKGELYGTTKAGGVSGCSKKFQPGCGTVFALTP